MQDDVYMSNPIKARICREMNEENMQKIDRSITHVHRAKDKNNTIFCYRNEVSPTKKKEHESLIGMHSPEKKRDLNINDYHSRREYLKKDCISLYRFGSALNLYKHELTVFINEHNIPVYVYSGRKYIAKTWLSKFTNNKF